MSQLHQYQWSQKAAGGYNKDSITDVWSINSKSNNAIASRRKAGIWQRLSILNRFTSLVHFFCAWKVPGWIGWPHILNQTHVIEWDSLQSFLLGKSYNRCKRPHQLLGAAIEILHVQAFVDQYDRDRLKNARNELQTIQKKPPWTYYRQRRWWSISSV